MAKLKALGSRLSALPSRVAWLDQDKAAASRARDAIRVDRAFYKTARWQRLRWSILERDLFTCRRCGAVEADSSKLVADHVIPAVERPDLIWDAANLQCLCKPCHDGAKQREDRSGSNARPGWIARPLVPVTLVCGPPGSGKTTFVAQRAARNDVVVDLDVIACACAGVPFTHEWDRSQWLDAALKERNRILASLGTKPPFGVAWVIMGLPDAEDRAWWVRKLSAELIVLDVPEGECLRRIEGDEDRDKARTARAIGDWWARYRA